MLRSAASGGHEHICHLAKEWGATAYNKMKISATINGHQRLRDLAREWGATWGVW
jgi:hypothetical protein